MASGARTGAADTPPRQQQATVGYIHNNVEAPQPSHKRQPIEPEYLLMQPLTAEDKTPSVMLVQQLRPQQYMMRDLSTTDGQVHEFEVLQVEQGKCDVQQVQLVQYAGKRYMMEQLGVWRVHVQQISPVCLPLGLMHVEEISVEHAQRIIRAVRELQAEQQHLGTRTAGNDQQSTRSGSTRIGAARKVLAAKSQIGRMGMRR